MKVVAEATAVSSNSPASSRFQALPFCSRPPTHFLILARKLISLVTLVGHSKVAQTDSSRVGAYFKTQRTVYSFRAPNDFNPLLVQHKNEPIQGLTNKNGRQAFSSQKLAPKRDHSEWTSFVWQGKSELSEQPQTGRLLAQPDLREASAKLMIDLGAQSELE